MNNALRRAGAVCARLVFSGQPAPPALAILLAAVAACAPKPPDTSDYVARVAAERESKDAQFMEEDDPIPRNRKAELLPLAYFPIDPEYNVPAALKPADKEVVVDMPTSTGKPLRHRIVGDVEFVLKGQQHKLVATVEDNAPNLNHITVMFNDLTSGTETYAAGRYVDVDLNPQGIYELDFNRAYNPYCYYNESYQCPYPPPENRLKVPIRAGERAKN
jgi:uncharacterized protein (DUF1684 family)